MWTTTNLEIMVRIRRFVFWRKELEVLVSMASSARMRVRGMNLEEEKQRGFDDKR